MVTSSSSGSTNACTHDGIDVLFLDIDGVLLPFGKEPHNHVASSDDSDNADSGQLFPDTTMEALSFLLTEQPTVKLVLSSTWRVKKEYCNDIIHGFRAFCRKRNRDRGRSSPSGAHQHRQLASINDFYDTTNCKLHTNRQWEIAEWLASQQQDQHQYKCKIRSWVALDDEELIDGECNERFRETFVGHVVHTQSHIGLTMQNSQDAVALFREQQQERIIAKERTMTKGQNDGIVERETL